MAKPLQDLQAGDVVRLKLPGNYWSKGVCKNQTAPRSYVIECNGHTYRRNRKDLRSTSELKPENQDIDVALTTDSTTGTPVTSTVDIMEQPANQSGDTDTLS